MVDYNPRNPIQVLSQLHGSTLASLWPRVTLVALTGLAASYLFARTGFKMPPVTHTMVGVALGLLLVFRTNASYDRYWEGRKLLGAMVNRIRDLTRQVCGAAAGDTPAEKTLREEVGRRLVVSMALIRQYLRFETDLDLLGVPLTGPERKALEPVTCRPVVYLGGIGRLLYQASRDGILSPQLFQNADQNITALIDSIGGAERIVKTPVPFAYAQHIKGFLFLFCFTVPFVLVDQLGWWTWAGGAAVAYAMFGIEEIGVEIEDPFGTDPNDLPVEAIEQGVGKALSDLTGVGSWQASELPTTAGAL